MNMVDELLELYPDKRITKLCTNYDNLFEEEEKNDG